MPQPVNTIVCTEHFNKIYDETFDDIKRFVALKCSDISLISDILQDIYMEYYRLILRKGTDYAANDFAVIFKIAKRKIYRYYTFKEKLTYLVPLFQRNEDGEEYCTAEQEAVTEEPEESVEDTVLTRIEAERIWSVIEQYSPEVRKIMYLHFSEGMSHAEIACELGCSLSNVKNKLYRTLSEIKNSSGAKD